MNGKLIGLLIRSNAAMIEAMGEVVRQLDKSGNHFEHRFRNLRSQVIAMAEEAEAIKGDVEIRQAVSIADSEGVMRDFNTFHPIVPISPAHQLEREPLKWSDIQVGRKFEGKFSHNGHRYLCVITETDVHENFTERAVNVRTKMLMIDQKEVVPFNRPLPAAQFKEEFLRWIE